MQHETNDQASTEADFEHAFTVRLVDMAAAAVTRGVPPDLIVRALLAAGLSFAQRFASSADIAGQLQPVLDAMKATRGADGEASTRLQ